MNSTFEPDSKHSITRKVSYAIKQEIYRYRTRSGVYQPRVRNEALQAVLNNAQNAIPKNFRSTHNKKDNSEEKGPALEPRTIFWEQIQAIYRQLQTSGLVLDDLIDPSAEFKKEITETLYRSSAEETAAKEEPTAAVHPILGDAPCSSIDTILGEEERQDDGCSMLTAEDYFQFRLQPAMEKLRAERPKLALMYRVICLLQLLATMTAGIFGFIGMQLYIPVVVALVSAFEALSSFWRVRQRLTDVSMGLSNLEQLTLWWGCLSRTQRRLHQSKNHLVDSTEAAISSEINCYGGAVAPVRRAELKSENAELK